MSISGNLRRFTGNAEVREVKGRIYIEGVSAHALTVDIKKIWSTSKISNNMFLKVTWGSVVIPSFFALELKFILEQILQHKSLRSSRFRIQNLINLLETNTWIRNIDKPTGPWFNDKAMKDLSIYTPLPHQVEFFEKYQRVVPSYGLKGMLLSAAPGSGKTLTDLWVAAGVNSDYVIIICPKAAIYDVWDKTLRRQLKQPEEPFISDRDKDFRIDKKYHIFHFEALARAVEFASVVSGKITIILDECHNLNDIKSLRTNLFIELCKVSKSANIIWASGTPVKALGFEVIPMLRTIDPLFTNEAEAAFRKMYGRDASRTLEILAHRLGIISYTVPKSVVMEKEPIVEAVKISTPNGSEYTLDAIKVKMSAFIEERSQYYIENKATFQDIYDRSLAHFEDTLKTSSELKEFETYKREVKFLIVNGFDSRRDGPRAVFTNAYEKTKIIPSLPAELKKPFNDAKSVIKYVTLKIRGECLGRILMRERVNCIASMLPHVPFNEIISSTTKKTVVFTSYVDIVDEAAKILSSMKYKPLKVYGDTNNNLTGIVNTFEKDSTANPLLATFPSLSTAVPLVMANVIIMLNAPWRHNEREQAIARAHRLGQDKDVYVYDIQLDTGDQPNISSRSIDIMEWSKAQVDRIMGVVGDVTVAVECNGFFEDRNLDPVVAFEDLREDLWRPTNYAVRYKKPSYEDVSLDSLRQLPDPARVLSKKIKKANVA